MRVGDKDVGYSFAANRLKQRRDMRGIVGTGIDNRHLVAADDVTNCAFEGEWARIVRGNRPHAGTHLLDLIGRKSEALVEWNVVIH